MIRKCPRCAGTSLMIEEHCVEIGTTDYGVVRTDAEGALIPPSDFLFEPGDIVGVWIRCGGCWYVWKSRRPVTCWAPAVDGNPEAGAAQ